MTSACPLCTDHVRPEDDSEVVLGMECHATCAAAERRAAVVIQAGSTPGLRERADGPRSGVLRAPSSGGGVLTVTAAPRYPDDWGADELWGEQAPWVFDRERDPRTADDFRHPWTTTDKWIVGICSVVIAAAWFAGFAGWL